MKPAEKKERTCSVYLMIDKFTIIQKEALKGFCVINSEYMELIDHKTYLSLRFKNRKRLNQFKNVVAAVLGGGVR